MCPAFREAGERMRRPILAWCSLIAVLCVGVAYAQVQTSPAAREENLNWRRYPNASAVRLRDVAALVLVTPELRADVAVAITHGGALPAPALRSTGRRLQIDGRLRRRIGACRVLQGGGFEAQVNGSWLGSEHLPTIHLRVPRDAVIAARGAAQMRMGRADSVDLRLDGCGDADLEGVEGNANVYVAGDRPSVRLYDADRASVRIAGDGAIVLGVVRRSLAVSIAGEGSVVAAHADGPTTIAIQGDGDVTVREGRAAPLSVVILGDGNVMHGGAAARLDVSIFGEGDVRVREVTGAVTRRVIGDGNVVVGGE